MSLERRIERLERERTLRETEVTEVLDKLTHFLRRARKREYDADKHAEPTEAVPGLDPVSQRILARRMMRSRPANGGT